MLLAGLRDVVDPDDPHSALAVPNMRAMLDDAWSALSDVLAASAPEAATRLLETLRRLSRIDRGLQRAQDLDYSEVSHRLGDAMARLEAAPTSVDDLVELAPRLIGDLGFDRAIISHIEDGMWVSRGAFVADDPEWADLITRVGQQHPQALVPGLFETEIVRRRRALVVTNVQQETRVHRPLAEATLSRSYVAAPIISRARVVGLLHADRYLEGRDTDVVDREVLYAFAQGLRLALGRAAIADQLESAGRALEMAAARLGAALSGVQGLSVGAVSADRLTSGPPPAARRTVGLARELLTRREMEVLELMSQGYTNSGVAANLVISEGTVKQHVKHILRKLRAGNRAEAVSRLYESGRLETR